MKTIALDAMGSDNAPHVEVAGAIAAARSGLVRVVLVGEQSILRPILEKEQVQNLPIEIHHASEVITMHDSPSQAVRRKRDASMRVAVELVKSKQADAVV